MKSKLTRFIANPLIFFIVCTLFIIAATIALTENKTFGEILENLAKLGGFLSGVGTLFAAYVAYKGVYSWLRQLKITKYLEAIRNTKIALIQYNAMKEDWLWFAVMRSPDDESKDLLQSKLANIREYYQKLQLAAYHLDVAKFSSERSWTKLINDIEDNRRNIQTHALNYPEPPKFEDLRKHWPKLNEINHDYNFLYKRLIEELEELEELESGIA